MSETAKMREDALSQCLINVAQRFCSKNQAYLDYVKAGRETLSNMIEERIEELRSAGVASDAHDALLNQFRGLRSRFQDLDAITRSLLLLSDKADEMVWEELLGHINALIGIELEARSAQMRAAMAAVIRDYVGGHSVETRTLKLDVEAYTAKRFHALTNQVRDVQRRRFCRDDTFTPEDMLERLVAFGSANVESLASLGSPSLFPTSNPNKR